MLPIQGVWASIPGQGTKILHAVGCNQKEKKEWIPIEGKAWDRKPSSTCQHHGWTSAEESCPLRACAHLRHPCPLPLHSPPPLPQEASWVWYLTRQGWLAGGPANTTTWSTSKPNSPSAPPASPLHWCRTQKHFLTSAHYPSQICFHNYLQ